MDASQQDGTLSELDIVAADGKPAIVLATGVTGMPGAVEWLRDRRAAMRRGLDRFGALLVRGLPITGPTDFAAARDVLID